MQTTSDYRSTAKQLTISIRKRVLYLQQKLDKADQTVLTQISLLLKQADLGLYCLPSEVVPGFLERGFICIKVWGLALLILSVISLNIP